MKRLLLCWMKEKYIFLWNLNQMNFLLTIWWVEIHANFGICDLSRVIARIDVFAAGCWPWLTARTARINWNTAAIAWVQILTNCIRVSAFVWDGSTASHLRTANFRWFWLFSTAHFVLRFYSQSNRKFRDFGFFDVFRSRVSERMSESFRVDSIIQKFKVDLVSKWYI